jgi:outer membrane immunogenic protein
MGPPVYKAPPPAPLPVYNWTGFYVGAGYGYGMWSAGTAAIDALTGAPLTTTVSNGGRGWLGMVTAGYDYQFGEHIVAGVFADWDPSSIKGMLSTATAVGPFTGLAGTEKESSSEYVGARVGWLVTPTLLSYWTGGYTEARFNGVTINPGGFFLSSGVPANTYHGWFLGGGMEAQLTFFSIPGFFIRTEYDYASYSSAALPLSNSAALLGTPTTLTIRPVVQTVLTGVTYKFNWAR